MTVTIERDQRIEFHELGTLTAVTRWIAQHDQGLAEWLKNARRAYQIDRADVKEEHRSAVLLLKDADGREPARIGLLDVGGATLEDVTEWSSWQNPEASRRKSLMEEEETQGNGGKAYMYRLFSGIARILGVRDGKRNCKGFEGATQTVERGTPGFMPDSASGRDVPISSVLSELAQALLPYGIVPEDLPDETLAAVDEREAFTLVEGVGPAPLGPRLDADDLIAKLLRHDQTTLAIEQLRLYAIHNGRLLNGGKPLRPSAIDPYPGLEGPFVFVIPEDLPLPDGETVSTTDGGKRPAGRVILHTSEENMFFAYRNLRPRWRIIYRTAYQMIVAKPVSDLVPATPGANFIYGTIELQALEPSYVDHGRKRPKDGPLVEAVDAFAAARIHEVAKQINDRRRRQLDDRALDEVQKENEMLDRFKNKFLANDGEGDGGPGGNGRGPADGRGGWTVDWGKTPDEIELAVPTEGLLVGRGVHLRLNHILEATVRDAAGRPVRATLQWKTSDRHIIKINSLDDLEACEKGSAEVWATVSLPKGRSLESPRVPVTVSVVDHVLLTPRSIELPLGKKQQITAEVTTDDGDRSTTIYLGWAHDADDQLIVLVGPGGWVTGNRIGRTSVRAGAGDPQASGIWARIPVDVRVVPNPDQPDKGRGFPRLLLTGRDIDPSTGQIREGDPDQPTLWQEPADFVNNIWWLNVQSPEAAFAFSRRDADPTIWRNFHALTLMDMVELVQMQSEFTRKGDAEQPDYWANHQAAAVKYKVQTAQQMWARLESWVSTGDTLE